MKSNNSLSYLYKNIIDILDNLVSKNNWRIKSVFVLTITSLILSTGAYFYLPTAMKDENWNSFNEKKEHPFTPLNYDPGSHAAKKTFRLTVPLIAKVLHLGNYSVFLLQFIASILLLFFTISLVEKITSDSISGLIASIGLVFIYAGHAGFTDINTWFDEFAYLFLLLAMFYEKPLLIFLFIQLACWTDERAIISSLLIFLWWKLKEEGILNFKDFFKVKFNSLSVLIALVFYVIERLSLSAITNLHTPLSNVGLKPLLDDVDFMGMAIWTSLEGFWILVIVSLILLWKEKKVALFTTAISLLTILALGSFSVFDKTRSGSYMFPIIFISIYILKNYFSLKDVRIILLIVASICFLFPSYYIISDVRPYILWYKPIFIRFLDLVRIRIYGS